MQWLEKLGSVTTNWKIHIMCFSMAGVPVTLVGDPTLEKTQISQKLRLGTYKKMEGECLWR